jgi:hypothetical protein
VSVFVLTSPYYIKSSSGNQRERDRFHMCAHMLFAARPSPAGEDPAAEILIIAGFR